MQTTNKLIYDFMKGVKKLADLNIVEKVSEMNGNLIQIHNHDYEMRVTDFEKDHDSAISSIGVGIKPNWTNDQCNKVFPRVDVSTMTGDYIDIICNYAFNKWYRYRVETRKFLNLYANNFIDKILDEITAANLLNMAVSSLRFIGAF